MPDEIPAFLQACDPDYQDLAAVLALAGLRVSEALALEPRDVDTKAGIIHVVRSIREGHYPSQEQDPARRADRPAAVPAALTAASLGAATKATRSSSPSRRTAITSIAAGSEGDGTSRRCWMPGGAQSQPSRPRFTPFSGRSLADRRLPEPRVRAPAARPLNPAANPEIRPHRTSGSFAGSGYHRSSDLGSLTPKGVNGGEPIPRVSQEVAQSARDAVATRRARPRQGRGHRWEGRLSPRR